jgi:selenocysteine-specific elongation factor
MRGFGTVVTGTLIGSSLRVGQAVELLPSGRRARVRALQSHGVAVETAAPGARTAANLPGVEVADVARGEVLTEEGAVAPTVVFDARLRWLADAPPLGERSSVELLVGTAERRARVSPIGVSALAPGGAGFARVHVEGPPLALLPGDGFVLRGFARLPGGGTTLGGGTVLDAAPLRRRRSDPGLLRELEALARRDPETEVLVRVARAGLSGASPDALRREVGLEPEALAALLRRLAEEGRIALTATGRALGPEAAREIGTRVEAALAAYHAREPLRPAMPRGALPAALPKNVAPDAAELALGALAAEQRVAVEPEGVRLPSHRAGAALPAAERALAERLRAEARRAGLEPPTLREWAERTGREPDRLRPLLAHLEREGALVHSPGDLWFDRQAVDALRERVVAHLRAHGALETPAYKELIGTSRKHAVPLMELLDAERVTLRVGNRRVLRDARRR